MLVSIVVLTNEPSTGANMISSVAIVKLESTNNDVLVLSNYNGEVCPIIDLSDTSIFPLRSVLPTHS